MRRRDPYKIPAIILMTIVCVALPVALALGGQIAAGVTMGAGSALLLGLVAATQ